MATITVNANIVSAKFPECVLLIFFILLDLFNLFCFIVIFIIFLSFSFIASGILLLNFDNVIHYEREDKMAFIPSQEIQKYQKTIDYLSIDTEGSEFEILSNFDFETWKFAVITVEHNYTHDRERIYRLLSNYGYQRKFENLSAFDDWYINTELIKL